MSDTKKPPQDPAKTTDQELSDLLDSALDDFSKTEVAVATAAPAEKGEKKKKGEGEDAEEEKEKGVGEGAGAGEWSDDFIKQATAQFESNMAVLLGGDGGGQFSPEQLQQSFQKMAEAASQVISNPNEVTDESQVFASTISQTLQGLNQGSEALQAPFSEQDLLSMFSPPGGEEQNAFLPFMQGMMQSLLSKEVLYPSLKDILEKYPQWLEENKGKISGEDLTRYGKQQELMERVCEQLEREGEADTADKKREQFEKVLVLMQKLQDYGQPPADLVGDVGPGLPGFDGQQPQNIDPNQCTVA